MSKFTGIKLNFDKKGEASIVPAQKVLPSRQDRIEELIRKIEDVNFEYPYEAIAEAQSLFFNAKARGFRPGIKHSELSREQALHEKFLKLIEPVDPCVIVFNPKTERSLPNAVA